VRAVSGGIITVSGTVNTQEIVINSGGAFNGKKLQAKETKVKVMAGGSADVNTTDILEAKVTAGGNIYVYGNPKDVKKNKFAGGKIVMKQ
jgi:cytoskeletal protein CcmA (bactofilin family)